MRPSDGRAYPAQPAEVAFSAPGDGAYAAFQPGAGIAMGYDDTKVIEAYGFLRRVAGEDVDGPGIDVAVASARALDAIVLSAATRQWVDLL